MFTTAAVCTSIDFPCLGISIPFPGFRTDMAQLPSVMTEVVMLIFKDLRCHIVILADILFIGTGFSLFMILKFDIAGNFVLFQIQEVFLTAVSAVRSHFIQYLTKSFPVFFHNRDQSVVIRAVIAHISMNDKIILHCDLDVIGRF